MTRDAVQRPAVVVALLALLVALLGVAGSTARGPHPADRFTASASGAPARTDHVRRAVTSDATPARASSTTGVAGANVDLAPAPAPGATDRLLPGATAPTVHASAVVVAGSPGDARAPPGTTA